MLPAESVTEVMFDVALFQPIARMLSAALRTRIGDRDRRLIGLRRRRIHLHKSERSRRVDDIVRRGVGLRCSRHDYRVLLRATIGP